jgi:exopolysaccharide biosynthesis polyprenyl glycosylphosphotransferase
MLQRETSGHFFSSLIAVLADSTAIFLGLRFAAWIRFETGQFDLDPVKGVPEEADLFRLIGLAVVVFLLVFRQLGLYKRPHQGRLEDKIPRILRACIISFVLYFAAEAALRLDPEFSRLALLIGCVTVPVFLLLERWIIFRIELHRARHAPTATRVVILGTDATARRLQRAVESDPFLRAGVVGFLRPSPQTPWPENIPESLRLGEVDQAETLLVQARANQLILRDTGIPRQTLLHLVLICEQRYLSFLLVPDLFSALTTDLHMHQLAGIPVMGMGQWPLDRVGARILKRLFDIAFSALALLLISPLLLLLALAVKLTSKGPVFYLQERCGEKGSAFNIIKFRTMIADAEAHGPGWTTPDDPRRTRIGGFLRAWNLDELPQFFNVLRGDMSVVGPRPERPVYVEQFKEEIERYMRRHLYKPGITGWAQVHGLRGDTSIGERITYDLFYLENWSLGLDFKIIIKTLLSRKNAY